MDLLDLLKIRKEVFVRRSEYQREEEEMWRQRAIRILASSSWKSQSLLSSSSSSSSSSPHSSFSLFRLYSDHAGKPGKVAPLQVPACIFLGFFCSSGLPQIFLGRRINEEHVFLLPGEEDGG